MNTINTKKNFDTNVLALVKGGERYVFLYGDGDRAEVMRALGRFASNPELSFSWYDAAVLSQKVQHADEVQFPLPRRCVKVPPMDEEDCLGR